ncbi:MAG TPA: hypothetical protein VH370_17130 [Humisphaera sp.]|jgi:hypothetical protein|nr:hypothetical protein [Humisphaera sp.]
MVLEHELKTYEQKLPELLADEGKFVLIHESEVAGCFGTYEDAIRAGYTRYGLKTFLVKQIHAVEQVQYFMRPISPCPT